MNERENDQILTDEEQTALTEEERRFVVDDDQKAEWCIRKIAEARKEMMDWIEFYVAQMDKVKARCESRIQFFETMLEGYFRTVPHKATKTQESYQLPSGKLVVKKQTPEIERDDAQIIQWLYDNSQSPETYLKIKESLDWAELKKVLKVAGSVMTTEDGEIIPGITVTERPDVFKVEVK